MTQALPLPTPAPAAAVVAERPSDPTLEAGPSAELASDGRSILADLRGRGIAVRLGGDGKLYAGPAERIDDASRALLTAHREAVRAALALDAVNAADDVPEHRTVVHVDVPESDPQVMDGIAAVLARRPGQDDVLLHLHVGGSEVTLRVGERFQVAGGVALEADLAALFRPEVVEPDAVEPPAAGTDGAAALDSQPADACDASISESAPRVEAGAQALDLPHTLITTPAELERAMPEILAAPALGVDTEGTGLDPFTARLRLVQLATGRRTYLVDLFRLPLPALRPILDAGRRLVGHNLKFDLRMLMAGGVRLPDDLGRRLSDTMLVGLLLEAGLSGRRFRLADLAQRYLGIALDKTEQTSDWSGDLTDDQLAYAAQDAAVLLPLRERLRAEIERACLARVALIEHRALPAMAWLEQTGAPFDRPAWLALAEAAEERRGRLERELDAMAPPTSPLLPLDGLKEVSTRWSSPKQVLRLLESRGVVLPDTRDGTLQEHRDADPLIPLLLEHRDAAKRSGAFGRDFLRFVHPVTGRIHADYFQLGSAAGRMSCRDPNVQQMPRDPAYRACVRAATGRALVKADYGAIEMRVAAEIANDRRLIEAFDGGADVHRLTAASIMGRPQTEITKADRQAGKAAGFGLLFGMGAPRLRSYAKFAYGVEMADEEAAAYRERFFETYAGLRRWHRNQPEGVVQTRTLAGRRRLGVENHTEKLNSPVQGSAADGLKLALGLLFETRDEVPSAAPILTVHDEIVLECDRQDAELARAWLERCMREGMTELLKRVPVEAEGQVGRDWSMADDLPERTEAA